MNGWLRLAAGVVLVAGCAEQPSVGIATPDPIAVSTSAPSLLRESSEPVSEPTTSQQPTTSGAEDTAVHTATIVTDAGRVEASGRGTDLEVTVTTSEGWTLQRDDSVVGETSLRWSAAGRSVVLVLRASGTGINHSITTESHG